MSGSVIFKLLLSPLLFLDMRLSNSVVFILLALTSTLHAQPSPSLLEMKWNVNTEEHWAGSSPGVGQGLQRPCFCLARPW